MSISWHSSCDSYCVIQKVINAINKLSLDLSALKFLSYREIKQTISSATSRCILVPFERYGRPNKWAQKVSATFFSYIFHVKTKWNVIYEYLKTKIFLRETNILPQMHWTSNIFGHSATTTWASLNYPTILNFKKTVCPKNVWMRHWLHKQYTTLETPFCWFIYSNQFNISEK